MTKKYTAGGDAGSGNPVELVEGSHPWGFPMKKGDRVYVDPMTGDFIPGKVAESAYAPMIAATSNTAYRVTSNDSVQAIFRKGQVWSFDLDTSTSSATNSWNMRRYVRDNETQTTIYKGSFPFTTGFSASTNQMSMARFIKLTEDKYISYFFSTTSSNNGWTRGRYFILDWNEVNQDWDFTLQNSGYCFAARTSAEFESRDIFMTSDGVVHCVGLGTTTNRLNADRIDPETANVVNTVTSIGQSAHMSVGGAMSLKTWHRMMPLGNDEFLTLNSSGGYEVLTWTGSVWNVVGIDVSEIDNITTTYLNSSVLFDIGNNRHILFNAKYNINTAMFLVREYDPVTKKFTDVGDSSITRYAFNGIGHNERSTNYGNGVLPLHKEGDTKGRFLIVTDDSLTRYATLEIDLENFTKPQPEDLKWYEVNNSTNNNTFGRNWQYDEESNMVYSGCEAYGQRSYNYRPLIYPRAFHLGRFVEELSPLFVGYLAEDSDGSNYVVRMTEEYRTGDFVKSEVIGGDFAITESMLLTRKSYKHLLNKVVFLVNDGSMLYGSSSTTTENTIFKSLKGPSCNFNPSTSQMQANSLFTAQYDSDKSEPEDYVVGMRGTSADTSPSFGVVFVVDGVPYGTYNTTVSGSANSTGTTWTVQEAIRTRIYTYSTHNTSNASAYFYWKDGGRF